MTQREVHTFFLWACKQEIAEAERLGDAAWIDMVRDEIRSLLPEVTSPLLILRFRSLLDRRSARESA